MSQVPHFLTTPERNPGGRVRTLHRNLLLPCDNLPLEPITQQPKQTQSRITRRQPVISPNADIHENEDPDSETEIVLCFHGINRGSSQAGLDSQLRFMHLKQMSRWMQMSNQTLTTFKKLCTSLMISNKMMLLNHLSFPNQMSSIRHFRGPVPSFSTDVGPSPDVYRRPRCVIRRPGYLQYSSLGKPSSFPVVNMLQAPQQLTTDRRPIYPSYPIPSFQPSFIV